LYFNFFFHPDQKFGQSQKILRGLKLLRICCGKWQVLHFEIKGQSGKYCFDFSIIEAYKRISGVHLVEIDASHYPNKVMKQIQEAIQHLL
jgi:hypothetical protein